MQVSKIITAALKQLGVLAAGETASGEEYADCADALHDLLSQWATHRLTVYKSLMLDIPLSGKGFYTVGRVSDGYEDVYTWTYDEIDPSYPDQRVLLPDLKSDVAHLSDTCWLDDKPTALVRDINTSKTGDVTYQVDVPFWRFYVPTDAKNLRIKAFTLPQNLKIEDDLDYPPAYERALKLSLAVEIAPMFGIEPTATLVTNQRAALDLLKRSNSTPMYVQNDLNVGIRGGGCGCH